jgi:hypothetical protein
MLRKTTIVLATAAALTGDRPLTRLRSPRHTVVEMDSVMCVDRVAPTGRNVVVRLERRVLQRPALRFPTLKQLRARCVVHLLVSFSYT